jgi:hypothetical protein
MEKAVKEGRDYTPRLTKFDWEGNGETIPDGLGKVGRKPKKTPVGRPSNDTLELVTHIKETAPQNLSLDLDVRERLSRHPSVDKDLNCQLCHLILNRPLQLATCNMLICMKCCIGHAYKSTNFVCPCGSAHTFNKSTIIAAPPVVVTVLNKIEVTCEGCGKQLMAGNNIHTNDIRLHYPLKLVEFNDHVCTKDIPAPMESVADVVAKPLTDPLSCQENKLVTSLVRRKLAQASEDGVLQLKTGGQV